MGDKSDNIPSIIKKCGPKTAEKLALNNSELIKLFEKNTDAKKQYDINRSLIDFNYINRIIKNEFLKNITFN